MKTEKTTHFGFTKVSHEDKTHRVQTVFDQVAPKYDLMNDLMSFGLHRLWKRQAVWSLGVRLGDWVLDLAAGTGDMSALIAPKVGPEGLVLSCDMNGSMLKLARDKVINQGFIERVALLQANAEALPFSDNVFQKIIIAFGLRNVTHPATALKELFRVLAPGGKVLILEFSQPASFLKPLYDLYSFKVLPWLGEKVLNDPMSYRYLAESIRMHPDQETLRSMMEACGFERCQYRDLHTGIVAMHTGTKF